MSTAPLKLLLIDDDEDSYIMTRSLLGQTGPANLEWVSTYEAGLAALREGRHDACLLDYRLGAQDGLELLGQAQALGCRVPIIMLTHQGDQETDLKAMRAGAADYLVKHCFDGIRLERSIRYAVERQQLTAALEKTAAAERSARLQLQQAHEKLQRTQAQLIQAEKLSALGRLVAGVAHEINNPLAYLKNDFSVLQRDLKGLCDLRCLYRDADAVLERADSVLFRRIQACGEQLELPSVVAELDRLVVRWGEGLKRIQDIVHSLRDFARGNASGEVNRRLDVNAGIQSTVALVQSKAQKRKVELLTDLGQVPLIFGSPVKINQVVLSLLENAIDACEPGGKVTVSTRASPPNVEIHVTDTGYGIDPAIRDRIFDPFFTTKAVGQGMGLGLSISHGIVSEHRGRIAVESTPGQGSHFTVYLPQPVRVDDEAEPSAGAPASGNHSGR